MINLNLNIMKSAIISILFLSFILGCSETEENETIAVKDLNGKWILTEVFVHPPNGSGWRNAETDEVFTIEFSTNSSFASSQYMNCTSGSVSTTNEEITLNYECPNFSMGVEDPDGTFKYSYVLTNDTLEISPLNYSCFEGCKFRLVKIP
jgi:hypothetical protein